MVVITADQRDIIFDAVRSMYTEVATRPDQEFHFPTGRRACEFVGYPAVDLDPLPISAVESFAGVGYPFAAGVIRPGDTVLDIGSGSGTDALIAAKQVGPTGEVIGLDMTDAMRDKLTANARVIGAGHVRVLAGNAENIPLPDDSVDVVTSNGVLNLVPGKDAAVREIFRVLRPGGSVQISDIVVATPPSAACRSQPQLWAECIVGATTADEYLGYFSSAGFDEVERLSHLDYFAGSGSEETRRVAGSFGARTMTMRAVKPSKEEDMATQTQHTNGVSVDQLMDTVNAIKDNPRLAEFRFRAHSSWEDGARCSTHVQGFFGAGQEDESRTEPFVLHGDEPAVLLGSNSAPNAVESVLHALASCLSVGFVYNAAARGMTVESLEMDMEGSLDLRAFLGLSEEVRPGYDGITVNYRVQTDAAPEDVDELCSYVQRTSPVLDIIRNPVPVTVQRQQ